MGESASQSKNNRSDQLTEYRVGIGALLPFDSMKRLIARRHSQQKRISRTKRGKTISARKINHETNRKIKFASKMTDSGMIKKLTV
jgi:hypothetical protein